MIKRAFVFFVSLFSAPVFSEISIHDFDINITQEECIKRSISVLASLGADKFDIFEFDHVLSYTANERTYFVVCRADKGVVFAGEDGTIYVGGSKFLKLLFEELSK